MPVNTRGIRRSNPNGSFRTSVSSRSSMSLVPVSAKQAESNLAKKVLRLSRLVKGIKPEWKSIDLNPSTTDVPVNTGYTFAITAIAEGTAINQRIGEKVQVRRVELNLTPHGDANSYNPAASRMQIIRVYVVQDKQQVTDTPPTLADLVDQPGLPDTQLFLIQKQDRFKVLYDSGPRWMCAYNGAQGTAAAIGAPVPVRGTINIKRNISVPLMFNGTTGADVQKNNMYLMIASSCVTAAAPTGSFDLTASTRVWYTDS